MAPHRVARSERTLPTTRSHASSGIIALGALGWIGSTTALITLAALAAAGCATTRHRYVDLAVARQEALAMARASAAAQGICPSKDGRALVAMVKVGRDTEPPWVPLECDKLGPAEVMQGSAEPPPRDAVSGKPLYRPGRIELSAHDRPGGTRLRLIGEPGTPLERILPDAPSHEYRVQKSLERQRVMVLEPMLRIGMTSAGGRSFAEAELGMLVGIGLVYLLVLGLSLRDPP